MTNETALRATELLKEIAELKSYKNNTQDNFDKGIIQIYPRDIYNNGKILRKEFLPISTKDFMFMYLTKVDEKIKSLEKELEAL